ncbi:MAG: hypothetical protein U0984_02620 [Prosthecobacter sp.]|nr:hypothetical protein [Prosthecobacter sp.]
MKTRNGTLMAVALAALSFLTWSIAQTPNPASPAPPGAPADASPSAPAAETPAGAPPPGATSVTGSIGIAVYNNIVYLIREGGATRLDAAAIPPGHMMTLDGRLAPLPPGIKLPGADLPATVDPRPAPKPRVR